MTESTPESTAPEPGAPQERVTFLVGSQIEFNRFCRDRGINPRSDRVRRVDRPEHLRGYTPESAQVLFLANWMDMPQGREMYNLALSRGLAKPWKEPDQ